MIIQRKKFLEILSDSMVGVGKQNDFFVFHNGNLISRKDNLTVSIPIKDVVDEVLEGCVKASELFSIFQKLKTDEVKISTSDNSWIFKSGKAKFEFVLLNIDVNFYNLCFDFENDDWLEIPENFFNNLKLCSMPSNNSKFPYVYIDSDRIISTDGHSLNKCDFSFSGINSFLLSEKIISDLFKFKNINKIKIKDNLILFKTIDDKIISINNINNINCFPITAIDKLFCRWNEVGASLAKLELPEELVFAVERASKLSYELFEKCIKLSFSCENIKVYSERSTGKYTEIVDWKNRPDSFKEFSFKIMVDEFENVLKKSKCVYISFDCDSSNIYLCCDNLKHIFSVSVEE